MKLRSRQTVVYERNPPKHPPSLFKLRKGSPSYAFMGLRPWSSVEVKKQNRGATAPLTHAFRSNISGYINKNLLHKEQPETNYFDLCMRGTIHTPLF